jgi:hypothetical protein
VEVERAKKDIVPKVSSVLVAYHQTEDVKLRNALLKSVLQKAVYNKEKWQQGDQFELILHPWIEHR